MGGGVVNRVTTVWYWNDFCYYGNAEREPDRANESDSLATFHPRKRKGVTAIMAHPTQGINPISTELAEELAPRILDRVTKRDDGCWIRYVAVNPVTGYSSICKTVSRKRTYYYAHRVMFVFANGAMPEDLTVDHLCEMRACCNPAHLKAVTVRHNVQMRDVRRKSRQDAIQRAMSTRDRRAIRKVLSANRDDIDRAAESLEVVVAQILSRKLARDAR